MRSFITTVFLTVTLMFSFTGMAQAQYYAEPTMANILNTLVRHRAVSINDDSFIDAYARTTNCPLYLEKFIDEFKWEKERANIRKKILKEADYFPVAFKYETQIPLGRYDFKKKIYPFGFSGGSRATNTFVVEAGQPVDCRSNRDEGIPFKYKFVLNETVRLDGLALTEKQGKDLFYRMEKGDNINHIVYVRFNMRVKYIATLATRDEMSKAVLAARENNKKESISQIGVMQSRLSDNAIIDAELDSIQYYEDKAMTKPIYTYRP